MKWIVMVAVSLAWFSHLFAADDLAFVDRYLKAWDTFAQGDSSLLPYLEERRPEFEAKLIAALRAHEKTAVSRLVFYPIIQVGGSLDLETDIGREARRIMTGLAITRLRDGRQVFFAGDIYFWWQDNRSKFDPFPLYEEWEKRPFAQTVAIRLYRQVRENEEPGANHAPARLPGDRRPGESDRH